jgi:DNA repair protein SbcC/Rad50
MIPLKLSLRNFMCYRENVAPLDFSGIHLACLSGDNGHGKSALLDAMTWALWGRSRAKSDDELIYLSADEMEVEFDFMLADVYYRVIRKRQRRKNSSVPSLEFLVRDGDAFRVLSGNSILDTERKITATLRMDYETFINSAFLVQGRADEFTIKPPGERKQILADILGLSLYDELEIECRDKAKLHETERRSLEAEIQTIDAELANEPRYHEEMETAQAESARLAASLKSADETLRSLREKKNLLDVKAGQLKDLEARVTRAERDIADADGQAQAHRHLIAEYDSVLAQREAIEHGYADLQQARAENDTLNRSLSRISQLQTEERQVERLIDAERGKLSAEQRALQDRLADLGARCQRAAGREVELAALQSTLDGFVAIEEQLATTRQQLLDSTNHLAAIRHANDGLKADMLGLKNKLDALVGVTHCPLCNTPLTGIERERVRGSYQEDGKQKGDIYRQNETEIKTLDQETARTKTEIAEMEARLRERTTVQKREAALAQILADAQAAAEQAAVSEARLRDISKRLDGGDYAPAEQARLAAIQQQMAGLGYQNAYHEQVRTRVAELGHFDSEKSRLETATHLIEGERTTLQRLDRSVAIWRKDVQADRDLAAVLRADLAELPAVSAALMKQDATVNDLQVRERYARETLGVARQKLEHCAYLRKQRADRVTAEEHQREERSIYEELAVAFGKKGIQAMIIEQAIPEIEEETNALLARMTDNRMYAKFETQRDTRKGDTIETLDIKLSDEVGTRNYEMYSGGETFRANFAIRIALSKLLARRAGARLQTLIIDEGFGTQDSRGRERLVEAINSISKDFEKILVITHIEELKDAFPVRIEITKTPDGSQIAVT